MADIEVHATGTTVHTAVGDRVVIRIPENATTGYQWVVREVGEGLELESDEFVLPREVLPGAAGERVVVVRPVRAGRGRIALDLKRAWESAAVDHFDVELDATAP